MRKLFLTLASVVLSITAFAGTHHIYVDNQSSWENVALFAWADGKSANDLLGNWPGKQPAAETVEIDGVNYLDFEIDDAKFAANFIFNNNGGGSQFDWLTNPSPRDYYLIIHDTWVEQVVDESTTYHLYVNDQTGWAANFWVYAWGDCEVLGNWDNQKKGTSDGTVTIDAIEYKVYNFHPLKGKPVPEYTFIFSQGGSETVRTTFNITEARDYYLNVAPEGATQVSGETYHIYAKNNTGWDPFKLYIWGDRELFGSWSGKEAESEQGDYKVFDMTLFKGETNPTFNLIFNNGGDPASQVEGFQVTEARDYYLNVTATSIVEEGELMYSIYINNQTAWATPALYAYDANDVPQMGTWPGTVSNETETIDEVVYIKYSIPESAFPCKLIFNNGINGEGSAQLADYALTTADNYYLVAERPAIRSKDIAPAEHHLYVRNLTSWDAFKLYAYGTYEAFGAWSTTTTPATTTIDGVEYLDYTFKTYDNTAHSFNLIFHEDDGDDNRQTYYIDEARDYYFTVTNDAAWEGLVGVKRFRPYIPMEHVYGYQYDTNGTVGTEWPGAELYPNEQGWYEFIVNKGRTVIFNNGTGEGAMQTGDLAYTEADPVADECAVWQGATNVVVGEFTITYMETSNDCNAAVALKYERDVTNGNYGTICLPYSAIKVEGAELFSIAGKDENGIYLDEASEFLKGVPYIFLANADQLTVYYWGGQSFEESADHLYTTNGLVGFINDGQEYTVTANAHNYILHNNGLYFVDSEVKIKSNRAYIDWLNVPSSMTPSSAPRRRIAVYNMPTGVENVQGDKVQCTKVIENGVLYLMYNGTKYNVQGQIVK